MTLTAHVHEFPCIIRFFFASDGSMLPSQDEKYCILTVLFEKHELQTENDAMLLVQNLAVMQKSIKQLAW